MNGLLCRIYPQAGRYLLPALTAISPNIRTERGANWPLKDLPISSLFWILKRTHLGRFNDNAVPGC